MSVYGDGLVELKNKPSYNYGNEITQKAAREKLAKKFETKRLRKGEKKGEISPLTEFSKDSVNLFSYSNTTPITEKEITPYLQRIAEIHGSDLYDFGSAKPDEPSIAVRDMKNGFDNFNPFIIVVCSKSPKGYQRIGFSLKSLESDESREIIDKIADRMGITTKF